MHKLLSFWLLLLVVLIGCTHDEPPQFPEAPKQPSSDSADDGILLSWLPAENATTYKIYRSNKADGDYTQIGSVTETNYTDANVVPNTTYFYKVTSVNAEGRENDVVQPISETYVLPPTPSPEIRIIVTDLRRDEPIADATIKIEGEGLSDTAQTDASGKHTFTLERDGTYTISVDKSGFMPTSRMVDSKKGDEFEIALKPIPKVIGTIADPANPFRTPAYVAFSPDGNRAYVTNQFGNSVSVIDVSTDRVLRLIDVGNEPLGLAVNPVKSELYVVNNSDGTISVIDTDSYKVVGEPIKVGKLPTQAIVNNDGTELYVVNSGNNSLSIVKLTELPHESEQIKVGRTPYGIAKSPDDRYLYVTNEADDNVSVVSLLTKSVERTIPVGNAPKDLAVSRDGRYALVSNHLGANVAVIDLEVSTPTVMMHEVGRLPMGIAIISEPDNREGENPYFRPTAYIALKAEAGVRIFDFVTMQIIDEQIIVGTSPVGIAAHPNGDKIYVVNSDEDSVTVLWY